MPDVHKRIHVSSRCHLNLTLHAAVDGLSEKALGKSQIGTTKRGIGPSYSTKAARDGVRVGDIYYDDFAEKLRTLAGSYRARYGDLLEYDVEEEIKKFVNIREKLRPYIIDAVEYMKVAQEQKRSILVEGSQALSMSQVHPPSKKIWLIRVSARFGLRQLPFCYILKLLSGWLHSGSGHQPL